ncbi:uncharacterized protein LOC130671482 [Microplitis mediator]|uniref:uncharacterized protein LOC130671482 n=1 Tax=Microplitis mediator TaxID=375433 RepID=UPI002553767A|nr:uncharacterized protein LOC130671482 [Microplitis mediator]
MDISEINEPTSDIDHQDTEDSAINNKELSNVSQQAEEVSELKVNQRFNTFEELEKKIKNYQGYKNCAFYKRDCVTIEKCRRQGVKRHIEPNLKYYSIRYCCINGGKKFKSMSTGERSSSTFQINCRASFKVRVTEDGNSLIISNINLDHNHDTTKKFYDNLPQTRRMTPEVQSKVKELLKLKTNKNKKKIKLVKRREKSYH